MTGSEGSALLRSRGDALAGTLVDVLSPRCTFAAGRGPITCAVSGGADSLALLILATATGRSVTAVHVDHGLREESSREAELVRRAAGRLGASFVARRALVDPGPNLEARAREARRAVLPPDAATGHTMDDQAETVLANLLRGAGADGTAGIRPGPLHPLLALRRVETRRLCESLGFSWVEDPSNDDRRFTRNRIRHELLPLCTQIACRDPVPLIARHAQLVREEVDLLDLLAGQAVSDPADAKRLASAPLPLARRAVRSWLRSARSPIPSDGYAASQPTGQHPPSLAEVDRVLDVARNLGRATELSGGIVVQRTKGQLRVRRKRTATRPESPFSTHFDAAGESDKVSPVQIEEASRLAPAWAVPAVGRVLVSAEDLSARVAELGAAITRDYAGDPPLLVGVLKGAMMFMSDLCRAIELPVDMDFMAVASYGSSTRSSGVVRIVKDLDAEVTGRRVLVIEDIIDSGLTLNYLRKYLQARHPTSVDICALLVKEGEQRVELDLRYVGFRIPSAFVVGYGLDVSERFRNLAGVHVLAGLEQS